MLASNRIRVSSISAYLDWGRLTSLLRYRPLSSPRLLSRLDRLRLPVTDGRYRRILRY
jgi:hypothetical protein